MSRSDIKLLDSTVLVEGDAVQVNGQLTAKGVTADTAALRVAIVSQGLSAENATIQELIIPKGLSAAVTHLSGVRTPASHAATGIIRLIATEVSLFNNTAEISAEHPGEARIALAHIDDTLVLNKGRGYSGGIQLDGKITITLPPDPPTPAGTQPGGAPHVTAPGTGTTSGPPHVAAPGTGAPPPSALHIGAPGAGLPGIGLPHGFPDLHLPLDLGELIKSLLRRVYQLEQDVAALRNH